MCIYRPFTTPSIRRPLTVKTVSFSHIQFSIMFSLVRFDLIWFIPHRCTRTRVVYIMANIVKWKRSICLFYIWFSFSFIFFSLNFQTAATVNSNRNSNKTTWVVSFVSFRFIFLLVLPNRRRVIWTKVY